MTTHSCTRTRKNPRVSTKSFIILKNLEFCKVTRKTPPIYMKKARLASLFWNLYKSAKSGHIYCSSYLCPLVKKRKPRWEVRLLKSKLLSFFKTTGTDDTTIWASCNAGTAPSVADFALYGQLSQLVVDSSPDRSQKQQKLC
jgi:hypothetical protein